MDLLQVNGDRDFHADLDLATGRGQLLRVYPFGGGSAFWRGAAITTVKRNRKKTH